MADYILDPTGVRDLAPDALDDAGRLRVLPAAWWAGTTGVERQLFGHRHGLYGYPTLELVEHLRTVIAGRTAIEIGAGHGRLAAALDIPATDNRQQETLRVAEFYRRIGQPTVPYGDNVIASPARSAVRRYRPQVVIGSWVTHRYDPARHAAGGNESGVDEHDVIAHCETYVSIGNRRVHAGKKIWELPHTIEHPRFVYSRANNGTPDFIAVWQRPTASAPGAGR